MERGEIIKCFIKVGCHVVFDSLDRMNVFFFFQAEDGIRDTSVTGVQTCALPILQCHWTNCVGGR